MNEQVSFQIMALPVCQYCGAKINKVCCPQCARERSDDVIFEIMSKEDELTGQLGLYDGKDEWTA